MVDYGGGHPNRPFSEALKEMRPGDIYTHFYGQPRPLVDDNGRILPYFTEARQRGILFDVGHGAGSMLFRQAVPAIRQGFVPDSISTDVHTRVPSRSYVTARWIVLSRSPRLLKGTAARIFFS
jgi:dihydroorotase